MLSRFCQPLFYGIGAGGGTYWSTLLVLRWFSPSTCWDINRPPWQLYQEGESHGCGGAFWWHLGLGVFRCFWWHLHPCFEGRTNHRYLFSLHFYTLLIANSQLSAVVFSQFLSAKFSVTDEWFIHVYPFIPAAQGVGCQDPGGSWPATHFSKVRIRMAAWSVRSRRPAATTRFGDTFVARTWVQVCIRNGN